MSGPDDPASWLTKAESDLLCIDNNLAAARIPFDAVCFHAQQAAEKALKAVIAAKGGSISRTHDLFALLDACAKAGCPLDGVRSDALLLNPYSVAARYPGLAPDPDADLARQAAAAARRTVAAVREAIEP